MAHPKFDEKELKVVQEVPGFTGEMLPIYDFPYPCARAWWNLQGRSLVDHDRHRAEYLYPLRIPDNGARGFVFEGENPIPEKNSAARICSA